MRLLVFLGLYAVVSMATEVTSSDEEMVEEPQQQEKQETPPPRREGIRVFDEAGMQHVMGQTSPAVIKINPPDCRRNEICKALDAFWGMAAKATNPGSIWEVDCGRSSPSGVCSNMPVQAGEPLFVAWNGHALEPYRGARDMQGLSEWIQTMLMPTMATPDKLFKDRSVTKDGTFVRFDARNCSGCSQLDATWNTLSDLYPTTGSSIIDCTSRPNICASSDVAPHIRNSAPSFAYFRDGGLQWYEGQTSVSALMHWVGSLASIPDDGMQLHRNFDRIYQHNMWVGDSGADSLGSGTGSVPTENTVYLNTVSGLISRNKIRSIVDVGCGDFHIMQHAKLGGATSYHGYDVSALAIDRAKQHSTGDNVQFSVSGPDQQYESADLLIVKDVLQHLPLEDAMIVVKQLHKFKYAIFVNDIMDGAPPNHDIDLKTGLPLTPGGYRSLDVRQAPFRVRCKQVLHLHKKEPHKTTCVVDVAEMKMNAGGVGEL